MGMKYIIDAFNYPYRAHTRMKQTKWIVVALVYMVVWSMKYDGVDLQKRR